MLVNCVSELVLLEKRYVSEKVEFFVLYGRLRVGKTELLTRFCESKRSIFFVSDLGSEISLRFALSASVNTVLFGPNQLNAVYSSREDLFHTLAQAAHRERLVPVTDTQPQKSRRGIYRLKDHYLRFWFRYVHPNRSQLERGGAQMVLDNQVLSEIDHFTSLTFEKVCLQFFWQAGLSGKLPFIPSNVGNWWNANEEIDLIVIGERDAILVECKWTSKPVGVDILAELERKAKDVMPEFEHRQIRFALCSRSGFTHQLIEDAKQREDVTLFGLQEILGKN